jgi:ribosomal protein L24E
MEGLIMSSSIINLCKDGGSGMSECTQAGLGHEKQCICSFYKESSSGTRCRFEVMEEFCDRVAAQKHAKGQPILLTDVNNYVDPEPEFQEMIIPHDNSGRVDAETIYEAMKTIENMKVDKMLTFGIDRDRLYKDENGEFHILEATEDILDHFIPYVDENGDIRYAESNKHKELMKETKDPCSDCCHAESKGGCDPCTTKELYELNKEQEEITALRFHELAHKTALVQIKNPPKIKWKEIVDDFKKEYSNQFTEECHHEDDYYSNVPIQDRRIADEMHGFSRWDSWEKDSNFETIRYIKSRELSKANIMERHSAGFLIVVSPNQVLRFIKTEHEKLLLDKQYLILYTPTGEVAFEETMHFLRHKAYMWRRLVPKDALPSHCFNYW